MTINNNKNNDSSAYLLESDNLWHARLGHVNYKSLQKMINMEILPNLNVINPNVKYVLNQNLQNIHIIQLKGILNL